MLTRGRLLLSLLTLSAFALAATAADSAKPWNTYKGGDGPGKGKHVVLVSGDEEYRSEEALTQLARILSTRFGFDCTVLYAIDPKDGTINPTVTTNIPGLEALDKADLMIIATRFRDLPDDQMKHVVDYLHRGKPVIGLRTATHAFNLNPKSKYHALTWTSKAPSGGFGRQVLGETWVAHHGHHGKESTRGLVAPGAQDHPIVKGIKDGDIWGPTDVYTVKLPLPGDSMPLVLGQVLVGMKPDDKPLEGTKNAPMMPVAWVKTYKSPDGQVGRVFTTTMGSSTDLASPGLRRLLANAALWAVGLGDKIDPAASVDVVGTFDPRPFGFGGHKKGQKPADIK